MIKKIGRDDFGDNSLDFEVTSTKDPRELTKARAQHEQFKRNCDWLDSHAHNVYSHRGKHISIAGQDLFVAESAREALALAAKAHPEDLGRYLRYIPKDRVPRIYANQRHLASL
jgi:hypothetical protein